FQQVFGGLWQPSTLSYAVEQFFEHGGGRAIIVRVANGARPPTITLPAGTGALRLAGVNPGSREYLRASIDYDGIPDDDTERFNLVVQRVRSSGSELIEDQEIIRRASLRQDSSRYLADLLLQSGLARAIEQLPREYRLDPRHHHQGGHRQRNDRVGGQARGGWVAVLLQFFASLVAFTYA